MGKKFHFSLSAQRREDIHNKHDDVVRNEGEPCYKKCNKTNGYCPDFCGEDGYCCKFGEKTNGCDGMVGKNNEAVCVAKKYLFKLPDLNGTVVP